MMSTESNSESLFHEEQRFQQKPLWALMVFFFAIEFVLIIVPLIRIWVFGETIDGADRSSVGPVLTGIFVIGLLSGLMWLLWNLRLVTDVRRDFALADSSNGWRRYRIPLTDSLRVQFGIPDLTIARHVRIWIEGLQKSDSTGATERRPLLMLGGVEIVGSRWRTAELTKNQADTLLTTVTLNAFAPLTTIAAATLTAPATT